MLGFANPERLYALNDGRVQHAGWWRWPVLRFLGLSNRSGPSRVRFVRMRRNKVGIVPLNRCAIVRNLRQWPIFRILTSSRRQTLNVRLFHSLLATTICQMLHGKSPIFHHIVLVNLREPFGSCRVTRNIRHLSGCPAVRIRDVRRIGV
uniref:(northern house mosquito) hypothetical protein n=1 Tax=Culex pipiens TaxID=7175 RepID=A0A8D8FPA2_CULPI